MFEVDLAVRMNVFDTVHSEQVVLRIHYEVHKFEQLNREVLRSLHVEMRLPNVIEIE